MIILLGFFFIGGALITQMTIVSQLLLLRGTADLVLLILLGWVLQEQAEGTWGWTLIAGVLTGISSSLPIWVPIIGYLIVTLSAQILHRQVWQIPIISLLIMVISGTLILQGITIAYLFTTGIIIELTEAFNLIILPSILLNLVLAIPIYAGMGEIARWIYPPEVET
jgi:hypothetical protein